MIETHIKESASGTHFLQHFLQNCSAVIKCLPPCTLTKPHWDSFNGTYSGNLKQKTPDSQSDLHAIH